MKNANIGSKKGRKATQPRCAAGLEVRTGIKAGPWGDNEFGSQRGPTRGDREFGTQRHNIGGM